MWYVTLLTVAILSKTFLKRNKVTKENSIKPRALMSVSKKKKKKKDFTQTQWILVQEDYVKKRNVSAIDTRSVKW